MQKNTAKLANPDDLFELVRNQRVIPIVLTTSPNAFSYRWVGMSDRPTKAGT